MLIVSLSRALITHLSFPTLCHTSCQHRVVRMSSSPPSLPRSSSHKSRKRRSRARSLSSVSGTEQSNGDKNAQLGEGTSLSIALPIQFTHSPEDVPLPPSPTGTSTSIPSVGEPSPDRGANKKQEMKHDQLAKVSQPLALTSSCDLTGVS